MLAFLKNLGITEVNPGVSTGKEWFNSLQEKIVSSSPVDGQVIGSVTVADKEAFEKVVVKAEAAFKEWRNWPAPKRGEIVRQIGGIRAKKDDLGKLVSYEMGKSLQGRIRRSSEMIDICDFCCWTCQDSYDA